MTTQTEYHNPLDSSYYVSTQHVERYRYALTRLIEGQNVLDIACGAGYGTAMISEHGCEAVGADYDDDSITNARASWSQATFTEANALELPFGDCSFDAVVSYETIEHVYSGEQFLSEMYRVLRPGGTFICSTPNIRYTAHPSYHIKEYEPEEFYKLVQGRFTGVERYAQYFKPLDRVRDLYQWHFYARLVSLLKKIRLKPFLKRVLRKNEAQPESSPERATVDIKELIRDEPHVDYGVKPFAGFARLRIMVAVARKEA